jgi:23S rRNA pseudouridine2457 synthase
MADIILMNKPYQVLSQFSDRDPTVSTARATLADFIDAPKFRVAGRLDFDSEGLLILTNDGRLQQRIANPRHKVWKTYWVQVEGDMTAIACQQLEQGVLLKDGLTGPARCRRISTPPLWERTPPIRVRQHIPDSWLEIAITEGRNRQIRRMTAAVGFPTLRLVRVQVGDWRLDGLAPGGFKRIVVGSTP